MMLAGGEGKHFAHIIRKVRESHVNWALYTREISCSDRDAILLWVFSG